MFLVVLHTEQGGAALRSSAYRLIPADLRTFISDMASALTSNNADDADGPVLDHSVDTLILLECVCIYIPPSVTQPLLQWADQTFSRASVVWYDPINLTDAFGRMMVSNLRVRLDFRLADRSCLATRAEMLASMC